MSAMHHIYRYTNNENGKVYIGKTNNLQRRKLEHSSCARRNNKNQYFYNAIRKYGLDSFTFDVLDCTSDAAEAVALEIHYISKYSSNDKRFGYNGTPGGEGVAEVSETERKRRSDRGKLYVGEKNPFYGKRHNKTAKNKISESRLGKPTFSGRVHSSETKKKISDKKKGIRASVDTEFKIGQIPNNAKVNFTQVEEIRYKFISGVKSKALQKEYGLSKTSIWRIVSNLSFRK